MSYNWQGQRKVVGCRQVAFPENITCDGWFGNFVTDGKPTILILLFHAITPLYMYSPL